MTKMKRTLAFVVAVVGMTLAAGSASALSSISLVWASNGTATIDSLTTPVSSTVTANIVLEGDTPEGIGSVFVSILFDASVLQAQSTTELSVKLSMGNTFNPVSPGTSIDNVNGVVLGFDSSAGLGTGCIGCTITLGSVVFHVAGAGGANVDLAVLPNGTDEIGSAFGGPGGGGSTTAQLNGAQILPEPTTALLVVGGLLGLGYAGRRSVRA